MQKMFPSAVAGQVAMSQVITKSSYISKVEHHHHHRQTTKRRRTTTAVASLVNRFDYWDTLRPTWYSVSLCWPNVNVKGSHSHSTSCAHPCSHTLAKICLELSPLSRHQLLNFSQPSYPSTKKERRVKMRKQKVQKPKGGPSWVYWKNRKKRSTAWTWSSKENTKRNRQGPHHRDPNRSKYIWGCYFHKCCCSHSESILCKWNLIYSFKTWYNRPNRLPARQPLLNINTTKAKHYLFPQISSSDSFISANGQIIHPGFISQCYLSFFAYCPPLLHTGSSVLKPPTYLCFSSATDTILIQISTNSCSDY